MKSSDYNKTTASQRADIADKQSQLDALNKQLKDTKAALDKANTTAKGTQTQLDDVTEARDALANCVDLLFQVSQAISSNDQSAYNRLYPQYTKACSAAQKYLN